MFSLLLLKVGRWPWHIRCAKVENTTADLVGNVIVDLFKPFVIKVKTLSFGNGKELCE